MGKPLTKFVYSAGGVVFRRHQGCLEIALVRSRQNWTLPKGLIEKGGKPLAAAIREVGEETGLSVQERGKLGEIEFWFVSPQDGIRYHKKVYYYFFEAIGGDLSKHDWEIEEVRFFSSDIVLEQVSYPKDRDILRQALAMIDVLNAAPS